MSLEQYTEEQLKEMSMVELAHEILEQRKEAIAFSELVKEVRAILELTDEQLAARLSQFYTDMNIDGRFLCISEGRWGLKVWYPYEQIEEEILPQSKPKKKRGKKVETEDDFDSFEDEEGFDDFDSFEEEELEELDEELDEELIEDEFDLEEELDEELEEEELELEELDEE
ncbi:MAG: DNA-directed RNA polymerase subunit delta [Bacillaceae bacterium]